MPRRAQSSFVIDKSDSTPIEDWAGGSMARTRWHKTFKGDLAGTSLVEAVMLRLDDNGPAAFVGIERFTCALAGRQGTFLLLHSASMHAGAQATSWTIVSGSGTGELAGIHGDGQILPNHDFVLTYELAGP